MIASVLEISKCKIFFITFVLISFYNEFLNYLPNEFISGNGTNIEAMIQHTRAVKMIASVFVISNRRIFFIKFIF